MKPRQGREYISVSYTHLDPEVRYSQGERAMAIARYTLAVDRRGRRSGGDDGAQTADFITCVAFDRAGEFAEKYFHQGTKVVVTGRIQTGSYTNRDGQKAVSYTHLIISIITEVVTAADVKRFSRSLSFSSRYTKNASINA